ncbi:type VI secretion system-associated protein TagO [Paenirhodobacter populi]|uniref:Type VI secretion system-associated protein TagO n=1 Tax=Paenirhodobacter populi TaxID=2306993 RepID=A0A443IQP5_9RHOB|nr:hypothetical protein D2T33_15505 [Sinirhodobacter populi]
MICHHRQHREFFMRFFLSSAILTAFLSAPTDAAITDCVGLDADLDRLACYDKESGRTPKVSDVTKETGQGNWEVRTQTSVMNDQTDYFMRVESQDPIVCRSYAGQERPALLLRCMENTTAILLSTSSCHLTSSEYNDYGDIQYRIDDLPARTKGFTESTSNDTLGLWSGGAAIPFIKSLFGHKQLIMRFTPFNESPKTVTFDISGIDEAVKPLRDACNW